ncbi:MAG: hypothetical protein IPK73_00155 [Candidatus Obscuribacter sp.]|nr:hypothetical protein [Candidatus Obscuribacter sp.]MBK9280590.1 hypothetical protein [Candidatus Obscuribacter sp.]MBL8084904.1 hypothetical protein [Candidatus Obscuribacter sp.]
MTKNDNCASLIRFAFKLTCFIPAVLVSWVGAILTFLGYVTPGILWCANFANTEQISLVFAFLVGSFGAGVWLLGFALLCLISFAK